MRISKTVNGVVHEYIYDGDLLISEQFGDTLLIYVYDEAGSPIGFKYRTTGYAIGTFDSYVFEKNLQGDIIAIYNTSGTSVATYKYDAWGNVISATGTMASVNPFRYRGYYYDTETGFYYLQSRYYDPAIGRFINADSISNLGADGTLTGYNLYSYCGNNPVMGYDPYGEWNWNTFFSGADLLMIGIGAISIAAAVVTCGASLAVTAVAGVTFIAGTMTAVNGVAEIVEAGTDYNFVRDGMYGGDAEFYEATKTVAKVTAEIGTTFLGMYTMSKGGNICFVAGTLVLTATGHVGIENIVSGDFVWAHNPETGETELKQVVQTFVNETNELVHIYTGKDEIICTNEHPFYSPVKGWTAASKLRAGDILVTVNGEYVVVEKVQHEILESPVKVYNFEVEGFHTYYVGSDDGVLVHNLCKQEVVASDPKSALTAKVSVGGESRHVPHAHIFNKNVKIASVDVEGKVIAGSLDRAGKRFVKKNLPQIADGINKWWYYGR